MAGRPMAGATELCDHVVKVYDDERDLMEGVGEFVAAGLSAGDLVLVVATPEHRRALEQLGRVDLDPAVETGQYLALDARETLTAFMVDGIPDPVRFATAMGGLIDGAAPRRVRIFGEMVSVLWDEGNVNAAILLEALWNDLAEDHDFSLYCAYAVSSFGNGAELGSIRQVCSHHRDVVAPASYGSNPPAVSELATNAVRHAGAPFRVSLSRRGTSVRIAVRDAGSGPPELRRPSAETANGRGIALVAAVCSAWGIESAPDGKVVWADVAA